MEHKICDWVRVRQWDDLCQEYRKDDREYFLVDELGFNPRMQKFCGRWGKITGIRGNAYRISFKGTDSGWLWNDAMLKSNKPYQVGDQVIVSSMDEMDRDFDMRAQYNCANPTFFINSEFKCVFQNPVLATIKDITHESTGVYRYHISCKENERLAMYLFSGYEFRPATSTPLLQVVPTLSFSDLFSDAAM